MDNEKLIYIVSGGIVQKVQQAWKFTQATENDVWRYMSLPLILVVIADTVEFIPE